ncbi:hypothetical protein C1645_832457 [Glomus cerebriforme]|uniref:F-box domain-containing protein n=1 Tax=Glomus cerebriforme TaxID=658196 RepID=A0A397SJZ4_9GLOM|nr:hypothetical protein C1645_832457 [Glomus cerebriforme]
MSKFNKDIIFSIFKELQDDGNSLRSSLLLNRTWCEIGVRMLWSNPWKYVKNVKNEKKIESLLNVIISHLSNEMRNDFDLLTTYKNPFFDYIGFCKHLDLNVLERMINNIKCVKLINDVKIEIIKLFINDNTRITHLYIPHQFNYQIHLIPGVEDCLSKLRFLRCSTLTNANGLVELKKICKSIKELEVHIEKDHTNDYGIVSLINDQTNLSRVQFKYANMEEIPKSLCKNLENSLIKHANNIQYFKINTKPLTKVLSSLKSLKSLEIDGIFSSHISDTWNHLNNISLPSLQNLKAKNIPSNILISLIENSKELNEIKVESLESTFIEISETYDIKLIQAIYQNCPNIKYLKIPLSNKCNLELENLLIKCQNLEGLYLILREEKCEELLETLAKSSPNSLFKFKFQLHKHNLYNNNLGFQRRIFNNIIERITLDSFKSFFYYWKGRNPICPMLLQTIGMNFNKEYSYLIDTNIFLEVIKKYEDGRNFDDFEWIKPKFLQKHKTYQMYVFRFM